MSANKGRGKTRQWLVDRKDHAGDECLIWPFSRVRGYGVFGYLGTNHYAHRYMCELVNGPPPLGFRSQAGHDCGNGHEGCVNPRHLSWKTPSENQQDRRAHNTMRRSGYSSFGRISRDDRGIMFALEGTLTHDQIAKMFDCSRQNVSAILAGKTFQVRKIAGALTPEQVLVIQKVGDAIPATALATILGVNAQVVSRVRAGKAYDHNKEFAH